jgi:hypothetical protein
MTFTFLYGLPMRFNVFSEAPVAARVTPNSPNNEVPWLPLKVLPRPAKSTTSKLLCWNY